jgi:TM2 domain-containing membrane protein YozV
VIEETGDASPVFFWQRAGDGQFDVAALRLSGTNPERFSFRKKSVMNSPLIYFEWAKKVMAMVFCRGCAKEIHESAPVCPHCGCQQFQQNSAVTSVKSQNVAIVLAVLCGGLGVHRFYLRKILSGVLYLLFCWTGIPALIAYVEALVYTFRSQDSWAKRYNNGVRTTPVHIVLKFVAVIFPAIMVIGILAAVAVPAYKSYVERARNARQSEVVAQWRAPATPARVLTAS